MARFHVFQGLSFAVKFGFESGFCFANELYRKALSHMTSSLPVPLRSELLAGDSVGKHPWVWQRGLQSELRACSERAGAPSSPGAGQRPLPSPWPWPGEDCALGVFR